MIQVVIQDDQNGTIWYLNRKNNRVMKVGYFIDAIADDFNRTLFSYFIKGDWIMPNELGERPRRMNISEYVMLSLTLRKFDCQMNKKGAEA